MPRLRHGAVDGAGRAEPGHTFHGWIFMRHQAQLQFGGDPVRTTPALALPVPAPPRLRRGAATLNLLIR